MRKYHESFRNPNSEASRKLRRKPMSISPASVFGGYRERIISPKTFSFLDEAVYTLVCLLFFSAMAFYFFTHGEGVFFGYLWAILAGVMLFLLIGQAYILLIKKSDRNDSEKDI